MDGEGGQEVCQHRLKTAFVTPSYLWNLWILNERYLSFADLQSQRAVTSQLYGEQLLPFGFERLYASQYISLTLCVQSRFFIPIMAWR